MRLSGYLIFLALASTCKSNPIKPRTAPVNNAIFDYVVIGGGTAGIVIASRLAEQSYKVALVEAGGYYEFESFAEVPAADVLPVGSDPGTTASVDWGFVARGQGGVNGRAIHFARGKCLGGSSALNFMIYQRPTIESMDQWASALNDSSYTFDAVLPFYKKSVTFTKPNIAERADNATTGFSSEGFDMEDGGPLQVSYPNYAQPFSSWMRLGMEEIGIKGAEDFNLGSLMGAQYCTTTIDPNSELRSSSQASYLGGTIPASLTIFTETLARRVLFDEDFQATGVIVRGAFGNDVTLTASEEVIISAGAFQSPQLLMVSGIGPLSDLQKLGIKTIADRPGVGQNMWDHPFMAPSYRVRVETLTSFATNLVSAAAQLLEGVLRRGQLTNPIADFLAWEKIPQNLRSKWSSSTQKLLAQFSSDWPEAEYMSAAGYIGNVSNLLLDQPRDGYQYGSILGVLITPLSRGNVTLKSADTSDLPIINPNWLEHPADQDIAIAMFKRIRQAFRSQAMAPIVIGEEYHPGTHVQSDTEILEFVKNHIMTLWHPACTCKMGTSNDEMAVVDSRARVFGVDKLRVVDASAFPFLPPGHPQATVYMLAEKIAHDIIIGQ
ncbi:Glucose-methanol-choline oxidoreductase [Penicillium malachiteum]|uniref:Glucose-methanol-choline oxidoreductase n=1 Tax=Penicillium malachiteum TaxID=1324776 RepID=UPI002547B4FF|nr:Glucose-methanol-choline oxidoreductase [Penicillium malachiteum]KAJ5730272.1 Glucose-methanol-choline oxidoreductase [Penicillium malachiteum]